MKTPKVATAKPPGLSAFFERQATIDALSELANCDKFGIIAGAGISRESGLPGWSDLLSVMLQCVAHTTEPFRSYAENPTAQEDEAKQRAANSDVLDREARNYAQIVLETHGLIGAASIVKSLLPEHDYVHYLRQALYKPTFEGRLAVLPGNTALEIARLWITADSPVCEVVTVNYDLLIEMALIATGVDPKNIQVVSGVPSSPESAEVDPETFRVVHLHGVIPHPSHAHLFEIPRDNKVVLAEDDYFSGSDNRSIANGASISIRQYCRDLLEQTACLFVGTSLSDPHLVTSLYGASATRRGYQHYSLNARQGDQPFGIDAGAPALEASRQAASNRMKRMGVQLLDADFFSQSALFLGELRHQHQSGHSHIDRLNAWHSDAKTVGLLPSGNGSAFDQYQAALRESLAIGAAGIEHVIDNIPALRDSEEHLALHLWAHDPDSASLVLIGRSDQQFFNSSTLESLPIEMPIKKLVIEAICTGSPLEAEAPDLESSRWGSMLVVPITLGSVFGTPPNIIAGALVLASSRAFPNGLFRFRRLPNTRAQLIGTLTELGTLFLTPPKG